MSQTPAKKMVILVADADAEYAIHGIVRRHKSLEIMPFLPDEYDIFRHPQRDPGCRNDSDEFLRGRSRSYQFALVIFDYHGCGDTDDPEVIEREVAQKLAKAGWNERCASIVIKPELEAWVWSDSSEVAKQLGWGGRDEEMRQWLVDTKIKSNDSIKPNDPKKAMQSAMRKSGKPLSASIFKELALNVSMNRCQDRAFIKFKETLQKWFPIQ